MAFAEDSLPDLLLGRPALQRKPVKARVHHLRPLAPRHLYHRILSHVNVGAHILPAGAGSGAVCRGGLRVFDELLLELREQAQFV